MLKYYLFAFVLAPLLTSCATVYHADLSLGQSNYLEKYDETITESREDTFGAPITLYWGDNEKADLKGFSFRAGITEVINDLWFTRIAYFQDQFDPLMLGYQVQAQDAWDENMKLTVSGLEVDLGINLWIFRPMYIYKKAKGKLNYQLTNTDTMTTYETNISDDFVFKGFGGAIDLPFSDSFQMYIEKQILKGEGSMSKVTIDTLLLGFRFGGWGAGKKSNRK